MRYRDLSAVLAVGTILPLGAFAQGHAAQLARYLNGTSSDGSIQFVFNETGCNATVTMAQTFESGIGRVTTMDFSFGAITAEGNSVADAVDLDIALIELNVLDGIRPVDADIILTSEDPSVRTAWMEQGATCEGSSCEITIQQPTVQLAVAGPSADDRAEFVLQDIRERVETCAATEQESN